MGTPVPNPDRSKATDDWYTPASILDQLPAFDLDPCVPLIGPSPWQRVNRYFTATDDGLAQPWSGHVWLNPPYSDPGPWVRRLAEHGDGIALVFARTETAWWAEHIWARADLLLFVRRRLSFVDPRGRARRGHNAPAPSVLIAFGDWATAALHASLIDGDLAVPFHRIGASS